MQNPDSIFNWVNNLQASQPEQQRTEQFFDQKIVLHAGIQNCKPAFYQLGHADS
jgi:hypothetical protein